jgi:hypothetical protein
MNPSDPNRQKTAARKTNIELFGKLLQKVALPAHFFEFIRYLPITAAAPQD